MKMIEIIAKNSISLIPKNKILSVVLHLHAKYEAAVLIHLGKKHIKMTFKNEVEAEEFYQKIMESILSDDKVNIIYYEEEEGVL